jgi:hypothetical protein
MNQELAKNMALVLYRAATFQVGYMPHVKRYWKELTALNERGKDDLFLRLSIEKDRLFRSEFFKSELYRVTANFVDRELSNLADGVKSLDELLAPKQEFPHLRDTLGGIYQNRGQTPKTMEYKRAVGMFHGFTSEKLESFYSGLLFWRKNVDDDFNQAKSKCDPSADKLKVELSRISDIIFFYNDAFIGKWLKIDLR